MPDKTEIGIRMKENYEQRNQHYLIRRMPVAIRVDMRAGHTFTKGFKRPFDYYFQRAMVGTMEYMLENIQGSKFGFCSSDEITILLTDYDTLETDAWFNYRQDKLCSISASMATLAFNRIFDNLVSAHLDDLDARDMDFGNYECSLMAALKRGAMFDARAFNIPKEEVGNLIVWRWLDAKRNSIQMVGQVFFSQKELDHKNQTEICQMLADNHTPWFSYDDGSRFGMMCFKSVKNEWITRPAYKDLNAMRKLVEECMLIEKNITTSISESEGNKVWPFAD